MKKVILGLFAFFSLIICVEAKTYTFENGKNLANTFLTNLGYSDYEKFLLFQTNIFGNSSFTKGGFINLNEYISSKNDKDETYLYDYNEYWTMTKNPNNSNYYTVGYNTDDNYASYSTSSLKNVKLTEFIKPSTYIMGSGTYTDPYIFKIMHYNVLASAVSNGTVTPTSQNVESEASITVTPKDGYEYNSNDCNGSINGYTIKISDIKNNISCKVQFKAIKYSITYNLNGGTASNKTSYTIEDTTFSLSAPIKSGYTFLGWTGSNGSTPQKTVQIVKGTKNNLSYTANWQADKIDSDTLLTHYYCSNYTTGQQPYYFTFTGNCKVVKETSENWKVYFYGAAGKNSGSGILKFDLDVKANAFLVGGGGASGGGAAGGGGGGYTNTYNVLFKSNTEYTVNVGSGGSVRSGAGSPSYICNGNNCSVSAPNNYTTTDPNFNSSFSIYANGGGGGETSRPNCPFGGDRDAVYGGTGASTGGTGWSNYYCTGISPAGSSGVGQGHSTCEFTNLTNAASTCPSGIRYSNGGNGGCYWLGGAVSGANNTGNGGTANYGVCEWGWIPSVYSFTYGGSGVVVIRNSR